MSIGIPIIDLGHLSLSEKSSIAQDFVAALEKYGFVYVVNHGVNPELQEELKKNMTAFFGRDLQEKKKFAMQNYGQTWRGYFAEGEELTAGKPDQKEGFYFGDELSDQDLPMHGPNPWPNEQIRNSVLPYLDEMRKLGRSLMELVALGLGLENSYFDKRYGRQPMSLFRAFSYSPAALESHTWGVGEHTDMGFLTILLQDQIGGLEAFSQGRWIEVPPVPNSFVINIGDILELWTWGILKATRHRVKNSSTLQRMSLPYFYDPSWTTTLQRIPKELLSRTWAIPNHSLAQKRWDQIDLNQISEETTYGQFIWSKVKTVFPGLANE